MQAPKSDPIREAINARAQAGLREVQQRCSEASDHIRHHQDLAAMGALDGVDERVRYVLTLLTVLRDLEATQPSS